MPDIYRIETNGKLIDSSQYADEINPFLTLVRAVGAKTALEIGVYQGGTSSLLAEAMGEGAMVVGVDCSHVALEAHWFRFVQGYSASYKTREEVENHLGTRKVDVLFIDAEHTEAAAMNDYEFYRPYLSENSLTAFHDICSFELWPMWNRLRGARTCDRSVEIIRDVRQRGCGIGVLLGRL